MLGGIFIFKSRLNAAFSYVRKDTKLNNKSNESHGAYAMCGAEKENENV